MVILENIDIDIDIDKAILQNIDIDKISNRFKFGISNRASYSARIKHQSHITRMGTAPHQVQNFTMQARINSFSPEKNHVLVQHSHLYL